MDQEILSKLSKDLKACVSSLSIREARRLVTSYLCMQQNRMRADNQIRTLGGDSHKILDWLSDNSYALEKQIASALSAFAACQPMGVWAMEIKGIGPVFAASLIAHLDVNPWHCVKADMEHPKCSPVAPCSPDCKHKPVHTAGGFWKFAGLDPSCKWENGQLRPWNAALKRTCWQIACSFEKLHNDPSSEYGQLYNQRKEYEQKQNEAGVYVKAAEAVLEANPKHAQAKVYKSGKLPDGHIRSRVLRYVAKQFLSDYHAQAYRLAFGVEPPLPYPIAILGHAHKR